MAGEYDKRRRENPASKRLTADELRAIRNARNCLGLKLGAFGAGAGAVLSIMMAIGMSTQLLDMVVYGICILLFVVLAIVLTSVSKKRQTKWGKYEALINWEGNTSLEYISESTGYPMNKVINDLQEMIDKKFLIGPKENLGAYIDKGNGLLVLTDYMTGQPIEPLDEAIKRKKARDKIKTEISSNSQDPSAKSRKSSKRIRIWPRWRSSESLRKPICRERWSWLRSTEKATDQRRRRPRSRKPLRYVPRHLTTSRKASTKEKAKTHLQISKSSRPCWQGRDSWIRILISSNRKQVAVSEKTLILS